MVFDDVALFAIYSACYNTMIMWIYSVDDWTTLLTSEPPIIRVSFNESIDASSVNSSLDAIGTTNSNVVLIINAHIEFIIILSSLDHQDALCRDIVYIVSSTTQFQLRVHINAPSLVVWWL